MNKKRVKGWQNVDKLYEEYKQLIQKSRIEHLRAVCCKDQLRSCNIEKTDFPKLCQNKGLGELVLKI